MGRHPRWPSATGMAGRPGTAARLNGPMSDATRPFLRSVVLDTTDPRRLADFYHRLLGYPYGPGFEPPADASADDPTADSTDGDEVDWILLETPAGGPYLAFQKVDELPESTWPTTDVPQQLHLDL